MFRLVYERLLLVSCILEALVFVDWEDTAPLRMSQVLEKVKV